MLGVAYAVVQKHHHPRISYFRRREANGEYSEVYPDERPIRTELNNAVTLTVTPSTPLVGSELEITLTWSGVPYPTNKDWFGFYSPVDANAHNYLDYQWNTAGTSSGSIKFLMTNMRSNFQFRYIANDTAYVVLAESPVGTWAAGQAIQVHVSRTLDASQMLASWNSDNQRDTPQVRWGTRSGSYTNTVNGTSHTYSARDMCNAPATTVSFSQFRDPGFFHDALMTGLTPSTRYYYQVGQNGGWSKEFSFVSAPQPGESFKFVMLADHGAVGCWRVHGGCKDAIPTTAAITNEVSRNGVNLILHVGDLSYGVGNGYIWDMWAAAIEPMAGNAAYMVSVGNHEYDYTGKGGVTDPSGLKQGWSPAWGNYGNDSGGECGVPTHNRFKMPNNGNGVFWYSFDHGLVHFVVVSVEHDFTPGSVLYTWMENDLKAVDRSKTPWIVFNAHRPMYSSEAYAGDYKVAQNMQKYFEDLIHKYQVDIFLAGHYHAYERTCPVYQAKCCPPNQQCTTHIVAGMAGIGLDGAGWYPETWSVFHEEKHFGSVLSPVSDSVLTDVGAAVHRTGMAAVRLGR
jgi:hypothetical protein